MTWSFRLETMWTADRHEIEEELGRVTQGVGAAMGSGVLEGRSSMPGPALRHGCADHGTGECLWKSRKPGFSTPAVTTDT